MKRVFIFLILFDSGSLIFAQAPDILWTRSYGFQEYEILCGAFELPSGDFLAGGYQQDTATYDYAGWIFRVDSAGNLLNQHHTGYEDLDEEFYCMRPGPDYSYVLTGTSEHPTAGLELYAVRIDSNANVLHANRLGSNHIGYGVTVLPSGQCVFVGELTTTPNQGLLIWTFPNLGFMFQNAYSAFAWLELYAVNQTPDSCLIVTGPVQINPFESRFFYLMKLDLGANCMGSQFYGFGGDDQIPYWVETTTDGGYIMCGYTTVGGMSNDRDLYIVKADSQLNQEWTRRYPHSEGRMIIRHPDGGYVVAGNDRWPLGALVMRLDENGDSLWTKSIPGGLGSSVSMTQDGGYIIAGATGYTTARKNDGFLARLGPDPVTLIEKKNISIPQGNYLLQNYPNPFNPVTNIRFDLPKSGEVQLIVYDALGRKVCTLVNEKMAAGRHEVSWDARDYPSGVYLCQLIAGDFNKVDKMLLVR